MSNGYLREPMMEHIQPQSAPRRAQQTTRLSQARAKSRRGGFTLVEVMVALAIFAVMMAIIFVPLNVGLKLFHIGQTRANTLQAAQATIDAIERELRAAVFVFPNEALPGVTDRAPYQINANATDGQPINPSGRPYVKVQNSTYGVCHAENRAEAEYVDNPSRLDFLLPDHYYSDPDPTPPDRSGEQPQPVSPLRPAPYVVTYYARRMNASDTALVGEPFDNPITLFRAQIPYRFNNGDPVLDSGSPNANLSHSRYPHPTGDPHCGTTANVIHRGSFWLYQEKNTSEPNLEPRLTRNYSNSFGEIPGSHAVMLPRGVALTTPRAYPDPTLPSPPAADYTPETTFRCADTNGDGKIDQVTITMALSSYDDIGADRRGGQPTAQSIRLTQTVSLPNVR